MLYIILFAIYIWILNKNIDGYTDPTISNIFAVF